MRPLGNSNRKKPLLSLNVKRQGEEEVLQESSENWHRRGASRREPLLQVENQSHWWIHSQAGRALGFAEWTDKYPQTFSLQPHSDLLVPASSHHHHHPLHTHTLSKIKQKLEDKVVLNHLQIHLQSPHQGVESNSPPLKYKYGLALMTHL